MPVSPTKKPSKLKSYPKQNKLIKEIVKQRIDPTRELEPTIVAGRKAGYNYPEVETYHTLAKPHVQEALKQALRKAGVTEEKVSDTIFNAINAKKDRMGKLTEIPDHFVRLKAVQLYMDVHNLIGTKSSVTNNLQVNNNSFNPSSLDPERLEQASRKLAQLAQALKQGQGSESISTSHKDIHDKEIEA